MALTQVTPDVLHNIQSNVTQVGTLSNLSVTGNISSTNYNYANGVSITTPIASALSTLTSNAAVQAGDIATIYANLGAVSGSLTTLTSNAAVQAGNIATIFANLGAVSGSITTLTSNAAVQAGDIATLYANAGAQAGSLASATTAITTANTAMKGYVDAVTTAWTANAGAQAGSLASATTAITTANTAMKGYADAITTAWTANAGAQAGSIATLTANAAVQSGAIATLQLTSAKGYISFRPSDGVVFASQNLYVSKIAAGNFTITLAAGIQNDTVNYAPIVTAISRGHELISAFTAKNLEVYGVGIFSITSSNFTVLSNSNYNTGNFDNGIGNDGNHSQQFEAARFDPERITVVVF
jgi:hypothetical protein